MAKLILQNVEKSFAGVPALKSISLSVKDGEFIALLGPSGCGKTTILRLLAGFEMPTFGQVHIGETCVADAVKGSLIAPEDRNIGIVFQSYALWPHMSVTQNVSYPLEVKGMKRAERQQKIAAALDMTGLIAYKDRMPSDLSGGQRQRVALARCLVSNPQAVLLDEPLANLDMALRGAMQDAFSDFHKRTAATMVYVTHDQSEAMAMADRIAVMSAGAVAQFDTPECLYNQPASRFVANFIGEGTVVPVQTNAHNGAIVLNHLTQIHTMHDAPNYACIRPENIHLDQEGPIRAKATRVTYLGGKFRLNLETTDGHTLIANSKQRVALGDTLGLSLETPWAFYETDHA